MMEILPAGYSDFRSREYWNSFFQAFDKKNFEWYGTYEDIKSIVYKCIKGRLNYCNEEANGDLKKELVNKNCLIINTGCGNSNISYEFYEDGFDNIINIDYSDVVINKMRKKFGDKMEYINIDISDRKAFDNLLENLEKVKIKNKKDFKIFFDKAFLDAYISCNENEEEICKSNAKNYFSIILKYLNKGDLFIIITLAQYYIIKEVVRNIYNENVKLEVIPFLIKKNTSEFKYHPFVFALYKSDKKKKEYTANFVHLENNSTSVISLWKLPQEINQTRENVNLHIFKKGKRIILDIFNNNLNKCTYNVIVYDSNNAQVTYNTVVIVVPFGYEFHSLYATAEGNEELARKAKTRRLLLVMKSNFMLSLDEDNDNKQNESAYKGKHDTCFTGSIIQSTNNCNAALRNEKRESSVSLYYNNDGNDNNDNNVNNDNNSCVALNGYGSTKQYLNGLTSHVNQGGTSENMGKKDAQVISNTGNGSTPLNNNLQSELYANSNSVNILLDSIKNELQNILNELALPNSSNFPIMALNEDVKDCKIIGHEKSKYCSTIIIRDVLVTEEFISENFIFDRDNTEKKKKKKSNETNSKSNGGETHNMWDDALFAIEKNKKEKEIYFKNKEIYKRQMIFSYDPLTVQSELIYTKKEKEEKINFEYIESASQYHINFCCSFFFIINTNFIKEKNFINICILGGGTNVLSNIIKSIFYDYYLHFDIIEIDETVHKFYSLFFDEQMKINEKYITNYLINDAYDYIQNFDKAQFYDIIFLDMNNSQNSYIQINDCKIHITCPHVKFLNKEIISSIKKILKENGILVINLLTRDIKARTYVYQLFKTLFVSVINISSSNKEINDVIVCSSEVITEERISTFHIGLMEMIKKNYDKWFLNFDFKNFIHNVKIM
ncbi:conserved Plasmodium protein, unknown function [Plasmodium malariae]|uniref:Uncharacterized protein n=1 Tax=Plasmodium malariae TaxID=5858 RepID=A0A1D3JIF1_PLAMA|nr:conserved Plasmodium protein, unknown function [Plasmodium malariae]SBT86241.1 conserved Plasmodium protein, unknown function [Plasmodium malariae]